jgi:pectate lyase
LGTLTGSVVDNGDGTYSQTLQGTPGTSQAVVSAMVEGLPLTSTAVVTLLPVSLSASTVTVDPTEVSPGDGATVTVTPKTGDGTNSGPGLSVVIETTLGSLTGQVVDNGDGTYTQMLSTSTEGTASVSASVSGLSLTDTATLSVVAKAPAGRIVGLTPDGTPLLYKSVQDAVNDAERLVKIMLAPGHFDEVVHIKKCKDLTIEALPTLGLTTIRGLRIMHCQNVTIDGIHVDATNSKCRGILVHKCDNVVLRNGLVQGTHRHLSGIRVRLDGGDVLLQNFGVLDCGGNGVTVKCSRNDDGQLTVLRCQVQDNQRNGLYLDKHAHVRIEGCTITSNGMKGWDRYGYGILRERQPEHKRCRRHHRSKHRQKSQSTTAMGESVLLLGNKVTGNHGRVKKGRSDENFGNYDQMIDGSDDQAPFSN